MYLSLSSPVFNSVTSPPETIAIPFVDVYSGLQHAIMSHSSSVRLNALRFLESNLVDMQDGPEEVVKRCLQGEEVALDIQGVRERVLRIGRVGQVVGDANGADLCARWLIGEDCLCICRCFPPR